MQNRWEQILPVLKKFESYLADPKPDLSIIQATDITWSDDYYDKHRPEGFPAQLRGIYFIFNSREELIYIGMTMDCYESRVWEWQDEEYDRRYIDIISFSDKYLHHVPSLEFFLITRLSHVPTLRNKTYIKGYAIPQDTPETI